jgi:hypothetical protein
MKPISRIDPLTIEFTRVDIVDRSDHKIFPMTLVELDSDGSA